MSRKKAQKFGLINAAIFLLFGGVFGAAGVWWLALLYLAALAVACRGIAIITGEVE